MMQLRAAVKCAPIICEDSVLLPSCVTALSAGPFNFGETSHNMTKPRKWRTYAEASSWAPDHFDYGLSDMCSVGSLR